MVRQNAFFLGRATPRRKNESIRRKVVLREDTIEKIYPTNIKENLIRENYEYYAEHNLSGF